HRTTLSTGFQGVATCQFACSARDRPDWDGSSADCLVAAFSSTLAERDTARARSARLERARVAIPARPPLGLAEEDTSEAHVTAQQPQASKAPRLPAPHVHPSWAGHTPG